MSKEWKPERGEMVLVWDHENDKPHKKKFVLEHNGSYYADCGDCLVPWEHIAPIKKTVRDWINELPEPYRERALKNTPAENLEKEMSSWLQWSRRKYSFQWHESPEGLDFWTDTHSAKKDGTEYPTIPPEKTEAKLCLAKFIGRRITKEGWDPSMWFVPDSVSDDMLVGIKQHGGRSTQFPSDRWQLWEPPKVKLDTRRVAGWWCTWDNKANSFLVSVVSLDGCFFCCKEKTHSAESSEGFKFSQDPMKPLDEWETLKQVCERLS